MQQQGDEMRDWGRCKCGRWSDGGECQRCERTRLQTQLEKTERALQAARIVAGEATIEWNNLHQENDRLQKELEGLKGGSMSEEDIVISQEFHNAGPWIVHVAGPNRSPKIAYLETREEADRVAAAVRQALRSTIEERDRLKEIAQDRENWRYSCEMAERENKRLWEELAETKHIHAKAMELDHDDWGPGLRRRLAEAQWLLQECLNLIQPAASNWQSALYDKVKEFLASEEER